MILGKHLTLKSVHEKELVLCYAVIGAVIKQLLMKGVAQFQDNVSLTEIPL